jgi:hypothetical protein
MRPKFVLLYPQPSTQFIINGKMMQQACCNSTPHSIKSRKGLHSAFPCGDNSMSFTSKKKDNSVPHASLPPFLTLLIWVAQKEGRCKEAPFLTFILTYL